MRLALTAAFVILLNAGCASAPSTREPEEDPKVAVHKVAKAYLNAMSGAGDDSGRELLLGGVTTNAKLFALENWRIVNEEEPRHEEGDVTAAVTMMAELDEASRVAMAELMGAGEQTESASVEQLTPAMAAQLMGPTQASADRLVAALPVLGYFLQVGKGVYWNPKNPARAVLASAGSGPYLLDVYVLDIETVEGPRKVPLRWPLKILRFKTAQLDTGWKVLPAADWNAE